MPQHVVVDGSNLATEGRSQPSLKQLNEAVMAYMADHPMALITVVVDATFGHRIDASEVTEFDEAVANNELVAPPAGAVGRGDAFVLSIADKVHATILTNDSYQEFHADYPWLFDEGRMVGGKPVPHIGWVFVNRIPVRGPLSRKVTAEAKRRGRGKVDGTVRVGSPDASLPMPVPKAPPPGPVRARKAAKAAEPAAVVKAEPSTGRGRRSKQQAAAAPVVPVPVASSPAIHTVRHTGVNELLPFLSFVEQHPVGTIVQAVVDHYSSHGAYVKVGDVFCYVPLRLMAEPAPRSARELGMKIGDTVDLMVHSLVAGRRSIDLAVPGVGDVQLIEARPAKAGKPAKAAKSAKSAKVAKAEEAPKAATPAKAAKALKATKAPKAPKVVEVPVGEQPPVKQPTTKQPTTKQPTTKQVATKQVATKVPAKKAAATKKAALPAPAPVKKAAPAKQPSSTKKAAVSALAPAVPAKNAAPAKKATAKKATAKQPAPPVEVVAVAPAKRARTAR
jgi:hypothetical protein